jgi:ribonuclease P protein subunit RPR2
VILVPGTTASVRVKSEFRSFQGGVHKSSDNQVPASSSHGHAVTYTCIACKTARRVPAPPTLVIDAGSSSATVTGAAESIAQDHLHPGTDKDPFAQSTPHQRAQVFATNNRKKRKKKKEPTPRLPPLFARDVGHVIFRGNEKLEAAEASFCG